jgi:YD repeat-containing protein
VTQHSYDGLNRKVGTLFADGTVRAWSYGPGGQVVQAVDERGKVSDTWLDGAGRVVSAQGPVVDGGRPRLDTFYDAAGNVDETRLYTGAGGAAGVRVASSEYDARNRRMVEHRADGTSVSWAYDAAGRVVMERDARGAISTSEYDRANRVIATQGAAVSLPGGATAQPRTEKEYDPGGNVLEVRELVKPGVVRRTLNSYDALNRLRETVDAEGQRVSMDYDAEGNRIAVTDGKGQTTSFEYDGLARLKRETDALGHGTSYLYDGLVKLTRVDALNRRTEYEYDARLRLKKTQYAGRSVDNRVYSYDEAGNLKSVVEPNGGGLTDVSYSYDDANRVVRESSAGVLHAYYYNLAGERV